MIKKYGALWGALALLLITAGTAYNMWQRTEVQLLWGYRPLLLLLSGWGVWMLLRSHFILKKGKYPWHWRWLGLSSGTSLLLGLGFPGFIPFPLLLFIAWAPFWICWQEINAAGAPRKVLFRYSYHTFILWNILSTYWVANTALVAGLFAIMVNALLMAVVVLLADQTRRIMPRFGLLPFVTYWIVFEYMHYNWELAWPWLTLGNGFAQWYPTVQWYEYTGVFGGSLWVLLTNLLVYRTWQNKGASTPQWYWNLGKVAALIALPIVVSLIMYATYHETGPTADVVVVQPNYEPHYEKFDIPESVQVDRFLALSAERTDSLTDYIVYPETSFGLVETSMMEDYPAFVQLRTFLQKYPRAKIVTGIDGYHVFGANEPHSEAVREQRRGANVMYYEIFNGAVQLSADPREPVPVYKKSKLVPGPEIFPFRWLFFFMKPLVEKLDGTTAGLATQPQRSVFAGGKGHIGPAICYESVFGEYFTGYVRHGAQAVFIMTNDGWWDNTAGHRQHLWYASLRAIETRRSIARSANTGISAFINQRGDISQATRYGEQAAIRSTITLNDAYTFYVKWGDMIARLALFLSVLFGLNTVVRVRKGGVKDM